ncbi:MAG: hypothetical protein IJZ33_05745 [Clostridia bacterium]|nr:hypothetical protein [Clostridia bacterium]
MKKDSVRYAASYAARGGIFSALGVLLLLSAQFFDVLDLSVATLAAGLLWLLILEYGKRFSFTVFTVTAMLGFLITPANTGVIVYTFVIGWFPFLKAVTDQKVKNKWLSILVKMLIQSAAFSLMLFLFFRLFVGPLDFQSILSDLPLQLDPQDPALQLFASKLNALYFGLNLVQWGMVSLYILFLPVYVFLHDLLLSRLTLFYAVKLRPMLKKRGILKTEYR